MTQLTTTITIVDRSGSYSCNPESVTVSSANTTLVYQLDAASAQNWQITGLNSSDQRGQLGTPVVAPDGNSVSVNDVNTVAETFSITVDVAHRQTTERLKVDPEVRNEPPK